MLLHRSDRPRSAAVPISTPVLGGARWEAADPLEIDSKNHHPRVSGVWDERESAVLRELCRRLGARFYDAEEAELIEP